MPSHMTALGFPVTTEQDFRHYVYQASEFGQKLEAPNGSYTQWALGNGIELWVRTNLHKRIIGMKPHFEGHARMKIGLIYRIPRYEHSIMDGAFFAWADPQSSNPASGQYPLVFDVPDYNRNHALQLPTIASVQLAAFAHELKGFENENEYMASQEISLKLASKAFIPSGMFTTTPKKGLKEAAQAQAIFSGHVLVTAKLLNPVTNQKFYWVRVQILGGEVDVIADPQVVQGKVVKGGIIIGSFWLSGRLVL